MAEAIPASEEMIHSEVGASGSDRWLNCLGSVPASRAVAPRPSGPAAIEGTRLHDLAELIMTGKMARHQLDDKDLEALELYLNVCSDLADLTIASDAGFGVEEKVSLWYKKEDQGYVDFWAFDAASKTLHIVDYKSGYDPVAPDANQLKIYAVSLIEAEGMWNEVDAVVTHIIQPKSGGHKEKPHTIAALLDFQTYVSSRIEAGREQEASGQIEYVPGEVQCKWCAFAPQCAPLREAVEALTLAAFKEAKLPLQKGLDSKIEKAVIASDGLPTKAVATVVVARLVAKIPQAKLLQMARMAPLVRTYLDAVEGYVLEHIEDTPAFAKEFEVGFSKPHLRWVGDPIELAKGMEELDSTIAPWIDSEPELISPAVFKKEAKELKPAERQEFVDKHTSRPPGAPKLVRK